ncbi:MAG: hypothetical protein V4621_02915 [Pseudomonadota bacterium]
MTQLPLPSAPQLRQFRARARDLLGLIRAENAVLQADGQVTLEGLYLHKMAVLQDLEVQAQSLSDMLASADAHAAQYNRLLQNVIADLQVLQAAMTENTQHHLHAHHAGSAAIKGDRPWH